MVREDQSLVAWVVGSFIFFCRPGARTPRVSGGALRASAAEIVHTYMHMMNSGRSRDPPPYHPW